MKVSNTHNTREGWLRAAANELRPYFEKLGFTLPDKMRFAIGFPSGGKRGTEAECWHSTFSADQHYEVIIRPDKDDPVEILSQLVPQLIHALLPIEAKHGKPFRDIALRVGLEGPMRHAKPAALFREKLQAIAEMLGPLPHGKLDFGIKAGSRKKSGARYLRAECTKCGYAIRLIPKWANIGLPVCPANPKHGALACELPGDNTDNKNESG